ncbi:hypothetical protein [Flagellimonas crocea]|uniref:hypothetical protein n=1 Tax=Flagellimonas crocea TaxID=3067311 RepID=UPI00296EDDE2|nr:hypothetical protein [Muricauda sp. DH64]
MRLLLFVFLLLSYSDFTFGQQNIKGRITDGKSTLSNVQISNLTSGTEANSDSTGQYQILANPRDELRYTYFGMDTLSIIVEDVTHIINIKMEPDAEELDGVTVAARKRKSFREKMLDYQDNKNLIKTYFGFLDAETSNFSLRITDEEDFENAPNINSIVWGKFAGVRAQCDPSSDELIVSMRSIQSINNEANAIFDVDGQILTKVYCSWLWGNVKRMAFIPSVSALSKYGTIGIGGVVVINTKTGTVTPNKNDEPFDQAKLRNNYVREGDVKSNIPDQTLPSYLLKLQQSRSAEEAKDIYNETRATYGNHPYFLLDSYAYFYEDRSEEDFANEIMESFVRAMKKNPVMLKALAYRLESEGRYETAHDIYKKVYRLRPDYAQSFIDMANSYRNLGQPKSATTLYARHAYLQDEGMLPADSMELGMIMKREIKNLFTLENGTLRIQNRKKYDKDDFATRLVFEWNDSEAEFDLQFVNPENQYYNWKHTLAEMPERIYSEKKLGYSMADFMLDDELPGIWSVNATYHGNKQLTPSYLKVTIYHNYGTKLQSKEIKTYRLGIKGTNQHLFDFTVPSRVVQSK